MSNLFFLIFLWWTFNIGNVACVNPIGQDVHWDESFKYNFTDANLQFKLAQGTPLFYKLFHFNSHQPVHIVKMSVIGENFDPNIIHDTGLHLCNKNLTDNNPELSNGHHLEVKDFFTGKAPKEYGHCINGYVSFQIEAMHNNFTLPIDMGFLLGSPKTQHFGIFTHFMPKESGLEGKVLRWRFRIWHTNQLRNKSIGLAPIGSLANANALLVPPGFKNFIHANICDYRCFNKYGKEIEIVGAYPHYHSAGTRLKVRHFRNGKELNLIYDKESQSHGLNVSWFNPPITFQEGDQIINECTYDTSKRNRTTLSLIGSDYNEEMCVFYIYYSSYVTAVEEGSFFCGTVYSKTALEKAADITINDYWTLVPTIELPVEFNNQTMMDYLKMSIKKESYDTNVENLLRFSDRLSLCDQTDWPPKHIVRTNYPSEYREIFC